MGQSESKQEEAQQIDGGIHIQIPRNQFYSGDVIQGQILIDLNTSFQGKALFVQLKGVEKTQFLEQEQQNDDENNSNRALRIGHNEFHDIQVKAYDFSQGDANGRSIIGKWKLPFSIVIADYLPSSFSYETKNSTKCNLYYHLIAYIEPSDTRKRPISITQEISVIQTQNHIEVEPQSIEYQSNPVLCFCCLAGSVDMQAQVDKKVYDYLEEMNIHIDCDASRCRQDVPSYAVKIQGRLQIRSNTNDLNEHTFDICKQIVSAEDSKINKSIKIRIPKQTNLGTKGVLIKYQNYIVIEPQMSTILKISSNPPLLLPFYISSFTSQGNNNNRNNNNNINYHQESVIPQIHPVHIQSYPQMQNQQIQPGIRSDQANYNYPSETVVLKQDKHGMNAPVMQNQYSTVTGQ